MAAAHQQAVLVGVVDSSIADIRISEAEAWHIRRRSLDRFKIYPIGVAHFESVQMCVGEM